MSVIVTKDLSKNYTGFTAVSNVNIQIPEGKVYGLLGPNGAGKSTLMKMFLGLANPTAGTFTVNNKKYPQNRNEILKEVGSFIEAPAFYGNLTGEENLDIIRRILALPKSSIEQALSIVGMSKWKDRQAKKYSLGMKQRLGLASALIGKPPILILDEPTNGLDPVGVHEIRTLIQTLPEKLNCTVILSSHLLSEIELVADTIGIMNHGNLLFEGTIDELKINFQPQDQTKGDLEETFLKLIQEDNRQRGLSDE
ncbi:ATP-binding cassette domain-containing protein [Tetragenococcus halophilus]|uniref:ABC transporter ATP-binding protein n=1 Tax=Tetragenococcus halophilus TaxID=51669 RepID=UPI001F3C229F|nr:ATP-binding cassette domain-containing protein [Tetragenococcus halophilus]MCF1685729.1 ATP-binding cassette domain-containing protein [Tetragenococcus halophilus]